MYSMSERDPSSGENSTSSVYSRACATAARTWPLTSSLVVCSLRSMWMSLVAMKVWMRGRSESLTAFQAASMSWLLVRASPQITGPSTSRAIAWTASKSPGEVIGKPASITSTPRRASWWAISSFSCLFSEIPGDCSPSRRVVSKIRTRCASLACSEVLMSFVLLLCLAVASSLLDMRLRGRHALFPPEGEQEELQKREVKRHPAAQTSTARPDRQARSRHEHDLADVPALCDHRLRRAGVLEAEIARHDRPDRPVVQHLLQGADPWLERAPVLPQAEHVQADHGLRFGHLLDHVEARHARERAQRRDHVFALPRHDRRGAERHQAPARAQLRVAATEALAADGVEDDVELR